MAHECVLCGMQCYCDGEDHGQEQQDDCTHLTGASECGIDDDDDGPVDDVGGEA